MVTTEIEKNTLNTLCLAKMSKVENIDVPDVYDATSGVALQKVTLKYVGHENAGYIKFSVFARYGRLLFLLA